MALFVVAAVAFCVAAVWPMTGVVLRLPRTATRSTLPMLGTIAAVLGYMLAVAGVVISAVFWLFA